MDQVVEKASRSSIQLDRIGILLRIYIVAVVATLGVLAALSVVAPQQAPREAWVHAVIVAGFAIVLPLRLRSARRGSVGALRAVGLIAAVLLLANVVEAILPDFAPGWMRVEMVGIAVLMALVIFFVARERM
ncbi:hypothetical protein GPX89_15000 [Nocardia sp. ET3-3]|uniref:Integral membrane protein n=1 Tax=Nocardia terrae TaxID=2675851 RepID=A0A7K1UVY8_9NOCA|nr:hypothetical protein [Nocardia terrae]MVU78550.1 hypothetical protein [Nocardia terrae]